METYHNELLHWKFEELLQVWFEKGTNLTKSEFNNDWIDPYDSIWLKLLSVIIYATEIFESIVMVTFVNYETAGLFGHYRTLSNQLLSHLYGGAAFYGVVLCGLRNLRVIFGPMPVSFCNLSFLLNKSLIWICGFLILAITITKFMFICVWKSIRQMNDDLLSRFVWNLAIFLGLFFTLTVPRLNKPSRNQPKTFLILYPSLENSTTGIAIILSILLALLMVAVRIGQHQLALKTTGLVSLLKRTVVIGISAPKNLDKMSLNLTLVILICIATPLRAYLNKIPWYELGNYPNWALLYLYQIFLPFLGLSSIALKIIIQNGKYLRRELLGP